MGNCGLSSQRTALIQPVVDATPIPVGAHVASEKAAEAANAAAHHQHQSQHHIVVDQQPQMSGEGKCLSPTQMDVMNGFPQSSPCMSPTSTTFSPRTVEELRLAARISKSIDEQLAREQKAMQNIVKLLLLARWFTHDEMLKVWNPA
ncbi:hypothetical protein AAVH_12887 [Aphelenchoides avenae]|nr:hypothetical protein AAVH_12887 [Aphelenchus avenae]